MATGYRVRFLQCARQTPKVTSEVVDGHRNLHCASSNPLTTSNQTPATANTVAGVSASRPVSPHTRPPPPHGSATTRLPLPGAPRPHHARLATPHARHGARHGAPASSPHTRPPRHTHHTPATACATRPHRARTPHIASRPRFVTSHHVAVKPSIANSRYMAQTHETQLARRYHLHITAVFSTGCIVRCMFDARGTGARHSPCDTS